MKPKDPSEAGVPPPEETEETKQASEALVQCEGFRCLAAQDSQGHWVDLKGNPLKVLKVINWI
jgi:hypothetical protein